MCVCVCICRSALAIAAMQSTTEAEFDSPDPPSITMAFSIALLAIRPFHVGSDFPLTSVLFAGIVPPDAVLFLLCSALLTASWPSG